MEKELVRMLENEIHCEVGVTESEEYKEKRSLRCKRTKLMNGIGKQHHSYPSVA